MSNDYEKSPYETPEERARMDEIIREYKAAGGWLGLQLASCDSQAAEDARNKEESTYNIPLADAMIEAGFTPPDNPKLGGITRFRSNGNPKRNLDAWLWLAPDGSHAAFGDYHNGDGKITWSDRVASSLTAEEIDRRREEWAAARAADEKERAEKRAVAAERAVTAVEKMMPAKPDNPYLSRKGVKPHGALQDSAGNLVIPILNADGEQVNYQTIYVTEDEYHQPGDKRPIKGGKLSGCFMPVEDRGNKILILCEGWATGATLAEANPDASVIAAINTGNLPKVAALMSGRYEKIIIAGDDDRYTTGNPGREAAEKAARACGGVAVFPVWGDIAEGTDFNDLVAAGGSACITGEKAPISEGVARLVGMITADDDEELRAIAAQQWLIDDVIPAQSFALVYGASGTGKSFVVLDMAMHIATGTTWQSFESSGECNVLYVSAEGGRGMRVRKRAWEQKKRRMVPNLRILPTGIIMDDDASLAELIEAIVAVGYKFDVVVLDTLARTMSGDENTAKDAGAFIRGCDKIKEKCGCTVIVVHHTGKDADRGARGSSAFKGATDTEISITGDVRSMLRIECTKAKDVEPFRDISMAMDTVVLAGMTDYKGRDITSLVPRAATFSDELRAGRELTPGGQAIVDIVAELGHDGIIPDDELRQAFYACQITKDMTPKQRSQAFRRAKSILMETGRLVDIDDGMVRLAD